MSNEPTLSYSSSALIVWDMQYGIASRAFNFDELRSKIRNLLNAFHAAGRPVIYSQHTGLPYEYMSQAMVANLRRRGMDPKQGFMREGSHDWQILDGITPAEGDYVLSKHTASFFVGTFLEQLLRNRGVDTLVLAGVSTEAGIEGTARHASYLGFVPVIVEDAVGSSNRETHGLALELMRKMFAVQSTEVVVERVKAGNTGRA
jgi:nicotinamidase-related amidase